ncbi:MAG: hypothetical protein AAFR71_14270 [Pseudomonadota bacterium]
MEPGEDVSIRFSQLYFNVWPTVTPVDLSGRGWCPDRMIQSFHLDPPRDDKPFEDLCEALFREIWQDPLTTRHGRDGQRQYGVDICSSLRPWRGVECKNWIDQARFRNAIPEIVQKAETFEPPLSDLVIACTLPRDAPTERDLRALQDARAVRGQFPVRVLFWPDLVSLIARHQMVLLQFYPEHYRRIVLTEQSLERAESHLPRTHAHTLLTAEGEGLDPELAVVWNRSARALFRRVCTAPLATATPSGAKAVVFHTEYSASWVLSLVREDGAITLQRLRTDRHVDNLAEPFSKPYAFHFHKDGLAFSLDTPSFQACPPRPGHWATRVKGHSLSSQMLRVIQRGKQFTDTVIRPHQLDEVPKSNPRVTVTGGDVTLDGETVPDLFDPDQEALLDLVAESVTGRDIGVKSTPVARALAWITRAGHFGVSGSDLGKREGWQPLMTYRHGRLAGRALGLKSFDRFSCCGFLYIASKEVAWVDLHTRDVEFQVYSPPGTSITDATVVADNSDDIHAMVLGYRNGEVEIVTADLRNEHKFDSRALFPDAVKQLDAAPEPYSEDFVAISEAGLAAVVMGERVTYFCDPDAAIVQAQLIDESAKLLTLNADGGLVLWDAFSNDDRAPVTLPAVRAHFRIADLIAQGEVYVEPKAGQLVLEEPWILGGQRPFRLELGAEGGFALGPDVEPSSECFDDHPWEILSQSALASQAPATFAVRVRHDSNINTRKVEVCRHRLTEAGVETRTCGIPSYDNEDVITIAPASDGAEVAFLAKNGEVMRVAFPAEGPATLHQHTCGSGRAWFHPHSRETPFFGYSPNNRFLLLAHTQEQTLHVFDRADGTWSARHSFGEDKRDWPANGFAFGSNGQTAYFGLRSGNVAELALDHGPPQVTLVYQQPLPRAVRWRLPYTTLRFVVVTGATGWIVASGDRRLLIWKPGDPEPVHDVLLDTPLFGLVASPTTDHFVTKEERTWRCALWQADLGETVLDISPQAAGMPVFAADGQSLLLAEKAGDKTRRAIVSIDMSRARTVEQLKRLQTLL